MSRKKQQEKISPMRECRLLKQQGYSDDELFKMGFDRNTIQKSVVSVGGNRGGSQSYNRCDVCGCNVYYLKKHDTCRACKLKKQLKEEIGVTF